MMSLTTPTTPKQTRGEKAHVQTPPELTSELADVVRRADLVYVSDDAPGWGRKRSGKGFRYTGLDGRTLSDKKVRARLTALAIPPAWTEVWICPKANGHLLATGRDERGRKQYLYHPEWHRLRDTAKFDRMLEFGQQLPRIRRRVARDLKLPGVPKAKVVAAVVRLLETTLIRVGNATYAKENKSYGLTTLRKKHVDVAGSTLEFEFVGKSGKEWDIELQDAQLARLVRRCEEIPGYQLFKYLDEAGEVQGVESGDVNAYLGDVTQQDITAKDFRTWAGTVLATFTLTSLEQLESESQRTKNVAAVIKEVAKKLGNTPAICRKSYVHPDVITCYLDGSLADLLQRASALKNDLPRGLRQEERAVLTFLQARLEKNG